MSQNMTKSKQLAVCAMCIALAFLLNQVSLFRMPQGGSITPASMLFVVLAGYWLGPAYGFVAGVAMGLLNTATGFIMIHPVQYVLDYLLAPGMLGLGGLFRKQKFGLYVGYVAGVFGRFVMVFLSGWIFFGILTGADFVWADIAMADLWPAFTFSVIYNITYIGPEMVVTLIIISLPAMKHAIDVVTKSIVPHDVYLEMTKHKGSISARARFVTGAVVSGLGGMAFVLASYITRLENLMVSRFNMYMSVGYVMRWCDEAAAYIDVLVPSALILGTMDQRLSRLYRMLDRNTGQIAALQVVGVLFITVGIALVVSVLVPKDKQ